KAMRISIPVLMLGATLALAGCDQKNSANVTIKDKDGSVTISANGQQFAMHGHDGAHVNSKLPAFVSIYPGAKVVSTVSGGDGKTGGGTVAFVSNAAPAAVIGFY